MVKVIGKKIIHKSTAKNEHKYWIKGKNRINSSDVIICDIYGRSNLKNSQATCDILNNSKEGSKRFFFPSLTDK